MKGSVSGFCLPLWPVILIDFRLVIAMVFLLPSMIAIKIEAWSTGAKAIELERVSRTVDRKGGFRGGSGELSDGACRKGRNS